MNPFFPNPFNPFPNAFSSGTLPMMSAVPAMGFNAFTPIITNDMKKEFLQYQKQGLLEYRKNLNEYLKSIETSLETIDKEITKLEQKDPKK